MKNGSSISVVMATYNGTAYLEEQLISIMNQSLKPSEVIICDDASTDDTVLTVKKFISDHDLEGWSVIENSENKGWRENFRTLFTLAKGDIIFPSDQDDIWDEKKIETMVKVMEERDCIEVLSCNYEPLYMDNATIKIWNYYTDPYGTERVSKVLMDKMWLETRRSGAAMCFRKELIQRFIDTWYGEAAYDRLLQGLGVAKGSFYILNEVLQKHRVHDANNTPSNKHDNSSRRRIIHEYFRISKSILDRDISDGYYLEENLDAMRLMNNFWEKRLEALDRGNVFKMLGLLKYLKLYPKKSSFGADLISAFREKQNDQIN